MKAAARFLRFQRGSVRGQDELRRQYANREHPRPAAPPRSLRRLCEVTERQVLGQNTYTLVPRARSSGWHMVYTHGGAFVNPLVRAHWQIVEQLVRVTGATVTVPLYPLAPEHTHVAAFPMLERVYRDLLQRVNADRIVLLGDSAGGNLALTQALLYRSQGLPLPAHIILLSPWLDLTMSNPEALAIEPRDVMLRCAELAEWGRWWAGSEDPRAPFLSPLFADLEGLPPIQIYQGTDDVFLPDARALRDRISARGGPVRLWETADAFHVFMGATFTPEARAVFRQIAESLQVRIEHSIRQLDGNRDLE